jgi:hypothetical protein
MLRFHINGKIVREQPQSFSLDKSSNSNGLRKITLAGAGGDDALQGYVHHVEVLPLSMSIKEHYVKVHKRYFFEFCYSFLYLPIN